MSLLDDGYLLYLDKIPPCSTVERDESSFQQHESMFGGKAGNNFERKKNHFFEIIAAKQQPVLRLNEGGCPLINLFQGCFLYSQAISYIFSFYSFYMEQRFLKHCIL